MQCKNKNGRRGRLGALVHGPQHRRAPSGPSNGHGRGLADVGNPKGCPGGGQALSGPARPHARASARAASGWGSVPTRPPAWPQRGSRLPTYAKVCVYLICPRRSNSTK